MPRILAIGRRSVAERIRRTLTVAGHTVSVCHSVAEAAAARHTPLPDGIVLDDGTPDHATASTDSPFARTAMLAPVLLLRRRSQRVERGDAAFGASAVLEGRWRAEELVQRVEALVSGDPGQHKPATVVSGPVRVHVKASTAYVDGMPVPLTPMQLRLLLYLIQHAGEVVSAPVLLQRIWDYPPGAGSASLVRMHILNLRAKLEPDPRNPTLLRTQPKRGYVWHGDGDAQP